jgi:hypothetical protein
MSRRFGRPVAVLLCCLLVSPAVSLSAAERAAVLGRVVAPPAQVNGVALPADATLLEGDRLATGARGWARVLLARGEQVHLAGQSEALASRQGDSLTFELTQGRVALRTHGSDLRVRSNGLEIAATADSAVWEVARLRDGLTLVAAQRGSLEVRSANRTVEVLPGQSFQVQTRLLDDDDQAPGGAGAGAGMSANAKLALTLAILGGLAAGIAIPLALASDNQVVSPSVP